MTNEPLKIKKRGEDGNKVITVRIKEDTAFVNQVSEIQGVTNATLVSYNGDYMG